MELALACLQTGPAAAAEAVVQLMSALNSIPLAHRHPTLGPPLQQALLAPLCTQVRLGVMRTGGMDAEVYPTTWVRVQMYCHAACGVLCSTGR